VKTNCQVESFGLPNSRWLAYATAGLATAFCSAPFADAEIHYSGPVNMSMQGIHSVTLPLISGASLFFDITACNQCYPRAFFTIRGAELGSARASSSSQRAQFLANLDRGIPVSHGQFGSVAGMPSVGALLTYSGQGNFGDTDTGAIGFKFDVGKGIQYGWVRLKVERTDKHPYHYVIKDYAWGDPGDSILTGQRSSSGEMVDAVSADGSLGLLAVGGAGLDAWRKERAKSGGSQP
jgi:hypothetical protein